LPQGGFPIPPAELVVGPLGGELSKAGYQDIFLWVLEENKRARNFYERQGFVCANQFLNVNIGGKDLREVQYQYRIK